jgi:hypothetical protein
MRLGQAAAALWVNEKTLDNAIRILGLPRPLDEDTVRALGLAFRAKYRYGIPLKRGFPLVREALIRPQSHESDAVAREVLAYLPELERGVREGVAAYKPLPRGPGWRDPFRPPIPAVWRRNVAIRRAIRHGLDLSLNVTQLKRSAADRLLSLSEDVEAGKRLSAPGEAP